MIDMSASVSTRNKRSFSDCGLETDMKSEKLLFSVKIFASRPGEKPDHPDYFDFVGHWMNFAVDL